jgi:hypothetical protein
LLENFDHSARERDPWLTGEDAQTTQVQIRGTNVTLRSEADVPMTIREPARQTFAKFA